MKHDAWILLTFQTRIRTLLFADPHTSSKDNFTFYVLRFELNDTLAAYSALPLHRIITEIVGPQSP
jgi:hypothetical protein